MHLPAPTDGQAMRGYTEHYDYDAVGNLLQLIHVASGGNWTRRYAYDDAEPDRTGEDQQSPHRDDSWSRYAGALSPTTRTAI